MANVCMMNPAQKRILALTAGSYDDHQKVRTASMNRIRNFLVCLDKGFAFDIVFSPEEQKSYGTKYSDNKLPDILVRLFKEGKIDAPLENQIKNLLKLGKSAKSLEQSFKKPMDVLASKQPLYDLYLKNIKGIAGTLSAKLIRATGYCENSPTISSLWRFFGFHIVCPVCTEIINVKVKKENGEFEDEPKTVAALVNVEGVCPRCGRRGIAPKRKRGVSLSFRSDNRKLMFVVSDCLQKARSPIYRDVYDEEKEKLNNLEFEPGVLFDRYGKPYTKESISLIKGHIHFRALRKVSKLFLSHYWVVGRTLANLPVSEPYIMQVPPHNNLISWEDVLTLNGGNPELVKGFNN